MTIPDEALHFDRLDQRRRWLTERIKAKETVGWETQYDVSERDALAWALGEIRKHDQIGKLGGTEAFDC